MVTIQGQYNTAICYTNELEGAALEQIQAEQSVQIGNALEQMGRLFQIPKQYLRGDSL